MLSFALADQTISPPAAARPGTSGGAWGDAYIIGKEDMPIPGVVTREGDLLVCRKSVPGSAAMGLMADAGAGGRLMLRTCLLPDRDRPYLLELELARYRIMLLINKIEQWGLSALAADDPIMAGFNAARELFSRALVHPPGTGKTGYAPEQADLARRALEAAVDTGEKLAVRDATGRLAQKFKEALNGGEPRPALGAAVHADQFAEPLQKIVAQSCDFVSIPLRWNRIEPDEGRVQFGAMDRWIEWAVRTAKLPVVGGPIIDFSPRACPQWLHVWGHDYDTLREFAFEHVKRVVTRYRRTVNRWTVCSALNVNNGFGLSVEQMIDLTRICVTTAKKAHPSAPIIVEVSEPFGEHATRNSQSIAPLLYAELVLGSGVAADGFGIRVQVGDASGVSGGGRSSRDLLELSAMLDLYSEFERPLHVTALGAPSGPASANGQAKPGAKPSNGPQPVEPGQWRSTPWSPEAQAQWLATVAPVCLSKPLVKSICWQALYDLNDGADMPLGGLITADGRAKPSLKAFTEMSSMMRSGKVPALNA